MIESTRENDADTTVVLVHPLGRRLSRVVTSTAIEVASILDAIAMVARSTNRQGITAVVAEQRELVRFPDAASAIKRLNDRVRVLEITPDPPASAASTVLDVDASIPMAEAPALLAAAISGRLQASAAPAAEPTARVRQSAQCTTGGSSPDFGGPHDPGEEAMSPPEHDADWSLPPSDESATTSVHDEFAGEDAGGTMFPPPSDGAIIAERHPADAVGEAERRALSGALLPDHPDVDPALGTHAGVTPDHHEATPDSSGGDSRVHDRRATTDPPMMPPPAKAPPPPPPTPTGSPPATSLAPGGTPRSPEHSPDTDPFSGFSRESEHSLSFAEAVRARESRYDAGSAPEEPLGDVDLVEAVLNGEGRIGIVAVQLIREQTGWHDLAFHLHAPERKNDAPKIAFAEVSDGGLRFGGLGSSVAGEDELALWARWLSRWLELGRRHELYRTQSLTDDLTGACNRRSMFEFLGETLAEARARRRPVTIMVFDIDDFKQFNDAHGHAAGDTILRETISLLRSVTRRSDRVCRIGGDEFAVVFADAEGPRTEGSSMPDDVEIIARRFQSEVVGMRFPRLGLDAPGTLSISAGLATYPWDGSDAETLLRVADERALESKRRGKNLITFGPGVPFSGDAERHAGSTTDHRPDADPSASADSHDDSSDPADH